MCLIMPRNLCFCSFSSFLIVLRTRFINKPESLRDLSIFIISFTSSSKIINVIPNPKYFLNSSIYCWCYRSNVRRKLQNPPFWVGIFLVVPFNKMPLFCKDLNYLSIFLFLSHDFIGLNPRNCVTLESWVFSNFIIYFTLIFYHHQNCQKSFMKFSWVPLFISDLNLLSFEWDNSRSNFLYWVIFILK